jgi:A/G-specific adenine glycosylase
MAGRADLPTAAGLHRPLLAWFRRNRRDLPWRRRRDPYSVWVSEVMLQQTQAATVARYFDRFIERFPSLEALARAGEEEVVGLWSGLGYYHRARNLLRGARHVLQHNAGVFPRTLEGALAVPGVGLYTASAVLSIAHGAALPVVDGNVRRVLARLLALRGPRWRSEGAYYNLADELLDRQDPGAWNEALMELGATVCRPGRPACEACPLRARCAGFAKGLAHRLPEGRRRRSPVDVSVAAALIERGGRVLLVRRPAGRLLSRLWELPQTDMEGEASADLARSLKERHGLDVAIGPLIARAHHAITYRRIRLAGYRASVRGTVPRDPERFRWATPAELASLPISSMTRKLVAALGSPQLPLGLG